MGREDTFPEWSTLILAIAVHSYSTNARISDPFDKKKYS
jgi:hypothetical protein